MNLRALHAATAAVFAASLVVQVFLAGPAIPQLGGNGSFATHRDFGYLIGLITLLVLVTAVIARMGRRRIVQSAGLLGLYVVQSSLPYMGSGRDRGAAPGECRRDVRRRRLVCPDGMERANAGNGLIDLTGS